MATMMMRWWRWTVNSTMWVHSWATRRCRMQGDPNALALKTPDRRRGREVWRGLSQQHQLEAAEKAARRRRTRRTPMSAWATIHETGFVVNGSTDDQEVFLS